VVKDNYSKIRYASRKTWPVFQSKPLQRNHMITEISRGIYLFSSQPPCCMAALWCRLHFSAIISQNHLQGNLVSLHSSLVSTNDFRFSCTLLCIS